MFAKVQHPTNVPSIQAHRWIHHWSSYHIIEGALDGIPNSCSQYYDVCINLHAIIFLLKLHCYVTNARASPMDHPPLEHASLVDNYPIGDFPGLLLYFSS